MAFRDRVEDGFEAWADLVLRRRGLVITANLILVATLSTGLARLEIETSFESYLPESNSQQQTFREFRSQFGSGERIVILLQPADVFDPGFLEALRRLHRAIEDELPFVDKVTSLVNARHLIGTQDSLHAVQLLDQSPDEPAATDLVKQRVRANPLYRNTIISTDESATAILIELDATIAETPGEDPDALAGFDEPASPGARPGPKGGLLSTEQTAELAQALDAILVQNAPDATRVDVAGTPLLSNRLGDMLTRDIALFVGVSLGLTGLVLFLFFDSALATLYPLLVVSLSVIGTLGWMGLAEIPLTAVTEILPSLLIAIGVADAVHILAMFRKRIETGDTVDGSIRWAMGHSGLAVMLTSLTTAASMAAFRAAELQPIIDLGRAAPVGVGLALVLSITLLPALLSLIPPRPLRRPQLSGLGGRRLDLLLFTLGRSGAQRPGLVLGATALLWLVAGAGAARLHFSQDDLRWLPEKDSIRIAVEEMNSKMKGAEPLDLLLRLAPDIDLRDPHVIAAVHELQREVASLRVGAVSAGQSLSVVDLLQETHRALGGDRGSPGSLPETRELVSQELLLFESTAADDLRRLVSDDLDLTRVLLTVPFVDALHYPRYAEETTRIASRTLTKHGLGRSIEVTPTGLLMLAGETFDLLFVSMRTSYLLAFGVISLLLLVLIGHFRLGLLSMLPNLTPILLVLGLMGWMGVPLDVSSMLVGGILIGVVVDDTIHFVHNFARYRSRLNCSLRSIGETLATTGRAMLVTSTALSLGFFVFTGASLSNVSNFGLLCGLGVILAFLADIVMLPALVAIVVPCAPECGGDCLLESYAYDVSGPAKHRSVRG